MYNRTTLTIVHVFRRKVHVMPRTFNLNLYQIQEDAQLLVK